MARTTRLERLSILLLALPLCVIGQVRLTLEEAGSRKIDTFAPLYEGRAVEVQGTVACRPISLGEYSHVVIEDTTGHGLTLDSADGSTAGIQPGDQVIVSGVIANRAGLPVLQPSAIRKFATTTPPKPLQVHVAELNSFAHVGTLIELESFVITAGENALGEVLLVGGVHETPVRIFMPLHTDRGQTSFLHYQPGDKVRVVGIASQYCPQPPHNRYFQVLVGGPGSVTLIDRGWIVSPVLLASGIAMIAFALTVWWSRESSMREQRARLRVINALSEEVISSETPADISRKISGVLPTTIQANDVKLYLVNKTNSALDRVPTPSAPEPFSVSIHSPIGPLSAAVALCYRNRSLLHIPDTRRSPVISTDDETLPRSVLLVPMFAQQELLGILVATYQRRVRKINVDELGAIQHLANQIGTSLRLQEQASMRDQLLRSEKMAAAGQLITGVATELRGPLEAIHHLANDLMSKRPGSTTETGLREIAFEAARGGEIVGRLISFAKADTSEPKPLDLCSVVNGLMEFRERERSAKGIALRNTIARGPLMVMGDRSQLEQVILNLLVHAEQSLAAAQEKAITIGSKTTNKEILITIDYSDSSPDSSTDPLRDQGNGDALGLQVCEAILHSHGGEIRLLRNLPSGCRFEVELPQLQQAHSSAPDAAAQRPIRPLTVLLVEPDGQARRKLLAVLSERGHRAVPTQTAEDAIDMVHRVRFDVVFSSLRLPGMNWVELFENIRPEIGSFVLVAEGYDADLSRAFKGSEGYLLSKPIDEAEAQRLLATIEARQESLAR